VAISAFLPAAAWRLSLKKLAFALKNPGDRERVVQTKFGIPHSCSLKSAKPPAQQPFEEVREALADSWRVRQARQRYGEVREELGNAVFEAIDRLDPVAERFGLRIHETELVPLEEVEIAGVKSDKLIAALKEAQAQGGQNLEPVELAPGKLAAVRVAEYVPPRALSSTKRGRG